MEQNKIANRKLFDGLSLIMEAWEMLGVDKRAPAEYNKMKQSKKQIGGQYGW